MDIFTEIKQSVIPAIEKKRVVPVGIYGSFQPENLVYLVALRDFLAEHECIAYLSLDLHRICPRPEKMGASEYNIKISRLMTAVNGIHIVFIFKEGEGEHNVNQSASIELDHLQACKQRHVMIFFEEGSFEQSRSLFKGLLELNVIDWAINSFTRHRNSDVTKVSPALLSAGLMFYHNRITDPETGYSSKVDLEMAIDAMWIQSLLHRNESGDI